MAWVGLVCRCLPSFGGFLTTQGETAIGTAKSTLSRLNSTLEERAAREAKLSGAVRTLLECIGEDPDREGLVRTPERYAQALMWMTRGYEERLTGKQRPTSTKGPHSCLARCHQRRHIRRGPRRNGNSEGYRCLQSLRTSFSTIYGKGKLVATVSPTHR